VFIALISVFYSLSVWALVRLIPGPLIRIFNADPSLIAAGIPALRLYFCAFFMMALQFSGQTAFVALGRSRQAIFFSIFRKVIIVVPLTLILPGLFGLGVRGVFMAEPVSNFVGGSACMITMLLTVWPELNAMEKDSSTDLL
jgi:Na+-driven multidrug efflux pump